MWYVSVEILRLLQPCTRRYIFLISISYAIHVFKFLGHIVEHLCPCLHEANAVCAIIFPAVAIWIMTLAAFTFLNIIYWTRLLSKKWRLDRLNRLLVSIYNKNLVLWPEPIMSTLNITAGATNFTCIRLVLLITTKNFRKWICQYRKPFLDDLADQIWGKLE